MKAVVFDFGGVLFRWQPLQLLQAVWPERAGDVDTARALATQIFESFTPDSDWARFDLGQVDEATLAQRIAQRIDAQPAHVRRVIDAIPAHLEPQLDTVALLHRLKAAGHRLFYLSNMPLPYAAHLEQANPFIASFDDGLFSGRIGLMKPDVAIFERAQDQFGLEPSQTLFIDDHAGNVAVARQQGWQAVQFVQAAACGAELQALGWLPSA
jgi:putative hydrolase of the HAD superfamily